MQWIYLLLTIISDKLCYIPDWAKKGFTDSIRIKVLDEERCSAHMHKTEYTTFPNLKNVICAKDIKRHVIGSPLLCFNDRMMQIGMMNVGIELLIKSDDVKMFYNIETEKTWILSALEDKQNKSKTPVRLLTKNYLKVSKALSIWFGT